MHLSANQIRTTTLKACVGAGVCRGVAEDIADGCVNLVRSGIDPTGVLISTLNTFEIDCPPTKWIESDSKFEAVNVSILVDGPSIVDLIQIGKIVVGSTDNMLLLLGLILTRVSDFEFTVAVDDQVLRIENVSSIATKFEAEPSRQFRLTLADSNKFEALEWKTPKLPSQENWAELYRLSEAILVPADAESRADAGAGSTDND